MEFIYRPKDGVERRFAFDPDELTTDEAEQIEEFGGAQWDTFGEWYMKVRGGGFRAWRVAIWILMRRDNPQLEFDAFKPRAGEIGLDIEPADPEELESAEGKSEPGDSDTDSP